MKIKEDIIKKICDDLDESEEDEAEEIAAQCSTFSPEKLEQIYSDIHDRHMEDVFENIIQNGSGNAYTGFAYDQAMEMAEEAFRKEKNIADNRPFTEDEKEIWDEWLSEAGEFYIKAYEEHGIDESVDEECLRTAISSTAEIEHIHELIVSYLYFHRFEDIWEKE
jgi:hypothetical protein